MYVIGGEKEQHLRRGWIPLAYFFLGNNCFGIPSKIISYLAKKNREEELLFVGI